MSPLYSVMWNDEFGTTVASEIEHDNGRVDGPSDPRRRDGLRQEDPATAPKRGAQHQETDRRVTWGFAP